jgi:hypothetical protein
MGGMKYWIGWGRSWGLIFNGELRMLTVDG